MNQQKTEAEKLKDLEFREAFLAGKEFNYTGHFKSLNRYPLHYNKDGDFVTDGKFGYVLRLVEVNEDCFFLHNPLFGRIQILFKECQLK